jgi:dolichol-phosphate mannosyltransferase
MTAHLGAPPRERVLVIVPTFNERASIAELVRRLFESAGGRVELLVVDDGSVDGTADLVKEIGARRRDVHVIERPTKLGLGTAYVVGFRWAGERGFGAVVEMDGDLSHDPADVGRLLDALDGADLAIGSRYVGGGRIRNWGVLRRILSRAGNVYARWCVGFPVADSTSGFRAYRAAALEAVDSASVSSEGYAFQIEMTRRVFHSGGRIVEIPITFSDRMHGRSKLSRAVVAEALVRVTLWGARDRVSRSVTRRKRALGS